MVGQGRSPKGVAQSVYPQMDWLKGMVPHGKYTGGRRVCAGDEGQGGCVQGMKFRGLCAGDEGQGAVCRG